MPKPRKFHLLWGATLSGNRFIICRFETREGLSLSGPNKSSRFLCNAAMSLPRPTPVSLPTGGTFAYISYHGAMVTSSARDAGRDLLRCQALDEWKLRPVQGKVATLTALVYTPALDMHLYTACSLSLSPPVLHLPHDNISVDLSVALFRCLRLVGGGWTEQIKVQPELLKVAQFLYERNWVGSVRSCPLCRCLPGTSRHVVMSCRVITPLVNQLRNILEAHLHALDTNASSPTQLLNGRMTPATGAWRTPPRSVS